ncbi:hypothetical protein BH24ACT5_BH24ACT5_04720 [soil metagenome]
MSLSSTPSATVFTEEAPASRLVTLPPWDFDGDVMTLGFEAVRWAERWLIQPNGPRAGKPFRFTADQLTFVLWWYAMDDQGDWLFNHGVRRLAKGSGKSPSAAVLALIEFCAPVRLAKKDSRALGGCRGRPVDLPWVQIAATAESQTLNTMRMVRAYAPKGSKVVDEHHLDPGLTRYYKLPEGRLVVITSSAVAADGAESSLVVADQTELWTPTNGGVELASTLADNLAKSGQRMIETPNAWKPGADTVAEATWDDWVAQEEGRARPEGRILYDARIAPPGTDLADPGSLRATLEWVYGDCDWKRPTPDAPPDVSPMMKRIYRPSAKVDDSKRKYLNWPTAPADAWVTPEEWTRLADTTVTVADGDKVVLFFDGSKSNDASALVGCRMSDGHVFTVGVWEPDTKDPLSTVNVIEVDAAVTGTFDRYDVAAFFADVREWESYALAEWPQRYGDRLQLWAVPSGRPPQAVAWDMRSHSGEFARACEACEAEIRDRAFTHDGNSVTSRHVANARRRPERGGAVAIGKESRDSMKKVDAAVCVVGARMVRRLVMTSPERTAGKRPGRVFGYR